MPATIKEYVSAINFLDRRDITKKIIDVQNNIGMTDVMGAFGRFKPADMYRVESFTNEDLWKLGTVSGAPTGSGTPTVTVTLTAETSGGRRLNDKVQFPDGKVGFVSAVTPGTTDSVTITSVDGTNLTVLTADTLRFYSNAVGEMSNSRESVPSSLRHHYNLLQLFRDTCVISDVQLLAMVEVPEDGRWTSLEWVERFIKLKAEVNAEHIKGQISVSTFNSPVNAILDPVGGGKMQFERGLDQYIASLGVNATAANAGAFDLADIAAMIDALLANKADKNYTLMSASKPSRLLDDSLKNLGSSGVTSARMNMDGSDINFEVDKFSYGGFRFQKMNLSILDHPQLFGGSASAEGIYFIPEGSVKVYSPNNGSSSYAPRIQVRYKPVPKTAANRGNDIWAEAHTGMFNPVKQEGTVAKAQVDWETAQCIEVLGAQHFGFLAGA